MKKLICLLLMTACFVNIWACLNEKHVTINHEHTIVDDVFPRFYDQPDKARAKEFLKQYDPAKWESYDFEFQSDIAVNLIYMGKHKQALNILRKLQKDHPGDYDVAANLGTLYELERKDDSALLFIKKAISLNPGSHNGSEWVHVKILEAKLEQDKHIDWLSHNRVLNTGVTLSSKKTSDLFNKIYDITYQLEERVPFTHSIDKLMANVFDELGDLYATQQSIQFAYTAYSFALHYEPRDPYGVKNKMKQLQPLLIKNKLPAETWQQYLRSPYDDGYIKALSTEEGRQRVKEHADSIMQIALDAQDVLSGNKKRRQEAQKNMLIWAGILVTIIAVTGIILIRQNRKK